MTCAGEQLAVDRPGHCRDPMAPFSKQSVTALRLPGEGGRGRRQNRYFTTTDDDKGLGGSPVSG
jgi:hypothetical protein